MKKQILLLSILCALSLPVGKEMATNSHSFINTGVKKLLINKAGVSNRVVVEQPAPITVTTTDVSKIKEKLPNQVTLKVMTFENGQPVVTKATAGVTWEDFTSEKVVSTFTLKGTVQYEGSTYATSITVLYKKAYFATTQNVYVRQGADFKLPEKVKIVYDDGSFDTSSDIEWIDEKPSSKEAKEYDVKGKVNGNLEFTQKVVVYNDSTLPEINISEGAVPSVNWDYSNDSKNDPAKIIDGDYGKAIDNWGPQQENGGITRLDEYQVMLTWGSVQKKVSRIVTHWLMETENNSQLPLNPKIAYKASASDSNWVEVDAKVTLDESDPDDPIYTFELNQVVDAEQMMVKWNNDKNQTETSGWNRWAWTGITEFEVFAKKAYEDIPVKNDASIKDIRVNDQTLPGFNENQYAYTFTLPYTDIEQINIVPTLNDSMAKYTIIPGEIDGASYKIVVVSADISNSKIYEVFLGSTKAPLNKVDVKTAQDATFTVGHSIDLSALGTDVIGRTHSSEDTKTTYSVNNYSGYASVEGSKLNLIYPGYIEVSATMEYGTSKITSSPLRILIEKGNQALSISAIERPNFVTYVNEKPELPNTIGVTYSNGLKANLDVYWKNIPSAMLATPGTFTLEGELYGSSQKAEATIQVLGKGDLQSHLTLSTVKGKAPSFPTTILGTMNTNSETEETSLTVDDKFKSPSLYGGEVGSVVEVEGVDGKNNKVQIDVIIADGQKTKDYVENQNGYPVAPQAFAENTNKALSNINFSNASDTTSYYVSNTSGTEAIFGYVLGNTNTPSRIELNHLSFDYFSGDGLDSSFQVKLQQLNQDLTMKKLGDNVDNYLDITAATNDILRNDSNWTDVTATMTKNENTYSFDFDYTSMSAFRFVVTKADGKAIKVNNLIGTTLEVTQSEELPTLQALNVKVGEKEPIDLLGGEALKEEYTMDYDGVSSLAVDPVLAKGNKGKTYVLNDMGDNTIHILLENESGSKSKEILLHLNTNQSNEMKLVASVAKLADVTVEKAEDFQKALPTEVEVTFTDGTKKMVGVTFDTTSFNGKKGTYNLVGTLQLDPLYANLLNYEVDLQVTVNKDLENKEEEKPDDNKPDDNKPDDNKPEEKPIEEVKGLRQGDIAAIVLGSILGILLIGGVAYFTFKLIRKKKAK